MENIPALSLQVSDTGSQYMLGKHRVLIANAFCISSEEYPTDLQGQRNLLLQLKKFDPKKYNDCFDLIVRGVKKDIEKTEFKQEKQEALQENIVADIVKSAKIEINIKLDNAVNEFVNNAEKINSDTKNELTKYIQDEVSKVKIVKHIHEIKHNDKIIQLDECLPECFETVLDLCKNRVNCLLVGPAGCGKTHLSRQIAKALDCDYAAQSCSAGMSESAFSGWLLPIKENGQFTYVQSEFVRIYENGGVFLFDEIDAADSNTLLFLNQALANGEFFLPQRFENPRIKRHDDFVAIAAANTFGNGATALYSGRNLLDGATMDRFRMGIVPMDYDSNLEEQLINKDVLKWGRAIRHTITNKNLRKIMSTRAMIDATKMHKSGWDISKIHKLYVSDWSLDDLKILAQNMTLINLLGVEQDIEIQKPRKFKI